MLAGDGFTLERLAAHMGLSADAWAERTRRRVDRWNHRTDADIDPLERARLREAARGCAARLPTWDGAAAELAATWHELARGAARAA
jgi:hypothetical protein